MPKKKGKSEKAEAKARKGPQRKANEKAEAEAKAKEKAIAEAKAKAKAEAEAKLENIGKRLYDFVHGRLSKAIYGLADCWLRVAAGLEYYSILLIEKAKAEGFDQLQAEKAAKKSLEQFILKSFDQNDRGNSPRNLQRQIDCYRWLQPVLNSYWLQKDFDADIEKSLKNNGYMKVLSYLRKSTVYDLSREFTSEEAKEIFKGLNVKRHSLSTEHCSEGFIFAAISAEAKEKAEKAKAKREAKLAAEGKGKGKGKKDKEKPSSETQGVIINLPDIPAKDIKHRGTYVSAYNRYLQGVCQFLTEARRTHLDDLKDRALVAEAFARLKAVNDVSEALLISIAKALHRDGFYVDVNDQFKVKSISEKAKAEAEKAKAEAEKAILAEAEKAKAKKKGQGKANETVTVANV